MRHIYTARMSYPLPTIWYARKVYFWESGMRVLTLRQDSLTESRGKIEMKKESIDQTKLDNLIEEHKFFNVPDA